MAIKIFREFRAISSDITFPKFEILGSYQLDDKSHEKLLLQSSSSSFSSFSVCVCVIIIIPVPLISPVMLLHLCSILILTT